MSMNIEFLETIRNNEFMDKYYDSNIQNRRDIEEFINEIVHVVNNMYDSEYFSDFLIESGLIWER